DVLLNSPEVSAISFVGSTPIARDIYGTSAKNGGRGPSLGGSHDHMLVLPADDPDLVPDQATHAGYRAPGERRVALSAVLAIASIADELIAKIEERIATLRGGNGAGDENGEPHLGPLISEAHRERVSGYVDIAEADGAKIVVDGRSCSVEGHEEGFFF